MTDSESESDVEDLTHFERSYEGSESEKYESDPDLKQRYENLQRTADIVHFNWESLDGLNDAIPTESDSEVDDLTSIGDQLIDWAVEYNVPLTALGKLLKILNQHNVDVPLDGRTLLKTPRSGTLNISNKSGGKYIYFGVEDNLKRVLAQKSINSYASIELSFNIDGLPVYKSRNISVWPVQGCIANITDISNKVFLVALYCGTHKPVNCEFLDDFIDELNTLAQAGFDGVPVYVKNIICDAPARALVKGIVQFNGRYGCDFCDVKGEFDGRMTFLYRGNNRTDVSFRTEVNPGHHKTKSPFLNLNIDMIKQFPIDPMHCVDLGVMKRLLLLWKEGPLPSRISQGHIKIINDFHENVRKYIPSDFNRKPRSLEEVKLWKATEFRMFLLYTGPIILKHVLDKDKYDNFMSFSVAIRILYSNNSLRRHASYANELLAYFVEEAKNIYSNKFVSYNVHCLLHLADIASHTGSLQECTAYKFEDNMTQIKRCIRGTGDPITQIANRLAEKCLMKEITSDATKDVKKIKLNMCYKLQSDKFAIVREVRTNDVICEIFNHTEPLYTTPCDSRIIGVYKGLKENTVMKVVKYTDISSRCIAVPLSVISKDLSQVIALINLIHTN